MEEKRDEKSDVSMNSSDSGLTNNPTDEERKLDRTLLWKRDVVMIPIMGVMYMLLFLDRTNIANARSLGIGQPDGLEGALHMPSDGYNTALWIFYVPFVLAEVPANLILNLNKIRPGIFLGGQMFLLGPLFTPLLHSLVWLLLSYPTLTRPQASSVCARV